MKLGRLCYMYAINCCNSEYMKMVHYMWLFDIISDTVYEDFKKITEYWEYDNIKHCVFDVSSGKVISII